ncbi:MAG: hypothetical protein ACLQOO_37435 [Terriglobia bacterium]
MRVAIRLGSPAVMDIGYAMSDHDPAMGLTRDSHARAVLHPCCSR